jgi:hypothetical protein
MDSERQIELDRSGQGLTEEEWEEGWHWCHEFDGMLVGPGQAAALVFSCEHPAIEAWKKTEEGERMLREMDERSMNRSSNDGQDDSVGF